MESNENYIVTLWDSPIEFFRCNNLLCVTCIYTVSQKLCKTVQNCFCQNFVKFLSILIIFGGWMEKWLQFYAISIFSTSPRSCYCTTLLNTKVPNFTVFRKTAKKFCQSFVVFPSINNFW